MARYETLVCDRCRREDVVPTHGWLSTKEAKGSVTEASPSPQADFCSPNCLIQYFSDIAIQASLEEAMDDAAKDVDG